MPARQQVAALELSRLEDAQPLGARINRALQVLATDGILRAEQLLMANGRWMPFRRSHLNCRMRAWVAADYLALCQAVDSTLDAAVRDSIQSRVGG